MTKFETKVFPSEVTEIFASCSPTLTPAGTLIAKEKLLQEEEFKVGILGRENQFPALLSTDPFPSFAQVREIVFELKLQTEKGFE